MQYGFADAIAKVGLHKFISDLFWIGMFYHLYNQVSNIAFILLYYIIITSPFCTGQLRFVHLGVMF